MSVNPATTPVTIHQPEIVEADSNFSYVSAFAKGAYTFSETSDTIDKTRVVGMWILSFVFPLFPAITFLALWIKDTIDMLKPSVKIAPPPEHIEEEVNLDEMEDDDDDAIDQKEQLDDQLIPVEVEQVQEESRILEVIVRQETDSTREVSIQPLVVESFSNEPTITAKALRRSLDVFDSGNLLANVRKGKHMPDITKMMKAFANDVNPSWVQNPGEPADRLSVLSMFETLSGILSTRENIDYLTKAASGWTANLILNALASQMTEKKNAMSAEEWERQISAFERFTQVPAGTFSTHSNCRKLLDAIVQDPWKLYNGIQQSLKAIQEARSQR